MERFKLHNRQTLAFWLAHWKGMLGALLVYCLAHTFYTLVSSHDSASNNWVLIVLFEALSVWFFIASILYIDDRSDQKKSSWLMLFSLSFKFIIPYFFLSLFVGLMGGLAMILFIVPGIYVLVKYSFTSFNLLFDNASITDSCRMSWDQTKGYGWLLFSGSLLYFGLPILIWGINFGYDFYLESVLLEPALLEPALLDHPIFVFTSNIINYLSWLLATTFMYQVYQTFLQALMNNPSDVLIDTPSKIIK
jgi:hypothetical protein